MIIFIVNVLGSLPYIPLSLSIEKQRRELSPPSMAIFDSRSDPLTLTNINEIFIL